MLLGEGLGRRHQRRLVAGFERPQHRVDGDHGLAGADLAHQQPLHRLARVEVGVDLGEGGALVAGRREGQRLEPAPDQLAGRAEARRRPRQPVAALAARQHRLVQEQLFEADPLAGGGELLGGPRGSGRPGSRRPTPPRWRRARSSAGSPSIAFGRQRARLLGPLADLLRAQALGGRMHGHEAPRTADPRLRAGPSAAATSSHSLTVKPRGVSLPVSRSCGRPCPASPATQGWLNQVARTWPESSPTLTPTMVRRPLRKGRGRLPSTSTRTVPVSPGSMLASCRIWRSRWRCGKRSSRSPTVRSRRGRGLGRASARPRRAPAARRRGRWGGASGRGRREARRGSARRRRRSARATAPPAATTSSADPPRGSRSRPRRGRGCRSPRARSARPRRRSR